MVRKEEIEFLKERAFRFLENAKQLFLNKVFDLAAFNIEQFCQLYMKYKLFLKIGDFPKTHSIKRLFKEFGRVFEDKRIKKFVENNIQTISNLENAYITSRYLPVEFEKIEVEKMLKFADKFKKFVDNL
jgi:HEPN domain-containing protein